jgi:hypothetical protein
VASAELIAHRDAWEWLAALAVDHRHLCTPPAVEDFKEGRVRTVLSGRSLIALLIELWNTRSTATPLEGDWAMAVTSYNRIASELADVTGEGETIRIVLDDGFHHDPTTPTPDQHCLPTNRRGPPGSIRAALVVRAPSTATGYSGRTAALVFVPAGRR